MIQNRVKSDQEGTKKDQKENSVKMAYFRPASGYPNGSIFGAIFDEKRASKIIEKYMPYQPSK